MKKITYLLGAGASALSLPLMNGMVKRMELFLSYLKWWAGKNQHETSIDNYFGNYDSLLDEVRKSTSFDQYAKMLSINDSPAAQHNLKIAKSFLNAYLLFEQIEKPKKLSIPSPTPGHPVDSNEMNQIKTVVDKRYRSFLLEKADKSVKWTAYNISLAYLLKNQKEQSVIWLERAIDSGHLEDISKDTFIESLYDHPRFQELVTKQKKKREEVMALVATYNFPEPEDL